MKLTKVLSSLRSGLWFIPLLYAVAGLVINVATTFTDRALDFELIPQTLIGGPDAALAILGTVAASMISLVATVLAITMVIVQLAMAQFSPRIVQTFLQDRPSQNAIGLFVATFVQAMLSMREVQVSDDDPVVPGLSVAVTFLLVVVDIVVLVIYVHHIGRSLRVSALIELVGKDTRDLMDELYTERLDVDEPDDPHLVTASASGVLSLVDREALVDVASAAGGRLQLVPAIGQFVPAGAPLVRLEGMTVADVDLDKLHKAVDLTLERSLQQDVAYGLRMLVDMGTKAISESPHADPTTTVQVIDRVHDVLRQLARRRLPDGIECDDRGQVRVVIPSMDWAAFVRLGFDEMRTSGAGSLQVSRRLRAALEDLLDHVPDDRRAPLEEQLALLDEAVGDVKGAGWRPEAITSPDPLGIGVEAGEVQAEVPVARR